MISDANTHTFSSSALELFMDKSIEILFQGHGYGCFFSGLTKLSSELMGCIVNKYTDLKELILYHAELIPGVFRSEIGKMKHLRCFDLNHFQISEGYMFEFSYQLEHVAYFKFSSSISHQEYNGSSSDANMLRVLMPYTTLNTIAVELEYFSPYVIKIQLYYIKDDTPPPLKIARKPEL